MKVLCKCCSCGRQAEILSGHEVPAGWTGFLVDPAHCYQLVSPAFLRLCDACLTAATVGVRCR